MTHHILFTLFMFLYECLWFFIQPVLKLSKRLNEGYQERILKDRTLPKSDIWIHAASAGESYLAREIIKNLSADSSLNILITTNTSQGKEILEKKYLNIKHQIHITYIPFDRPSIIRKAIGMSDPDLLVLIESELWPGLMYECKKLKKKIMVVNGRMTERSFNRYMKGPCIWKYMKPDRILAISEDDKHRFSTLFKQKSAYHVSNIKFDRMDKPDIQSINDPREDFLVLASIRKEEEHLVLLMIQKITHCIPNLSIGLFPRHMHRIDSWKKTLTNHNLDWCLRSEATIEPFQKRIILWDQFGELTDAYRKAKASFVGGSLVSLGGQNFIESFSNGLKPVIGPFYDDFKWAGEEIFSQELVEKSSDWDDAADKLIDILQSQVIY